MLTQLSKTLVCIQCSYKIIGPELRAGRECPSCHCPMYFDGGEVADFRINRRPAPRFGDGGVIPAGVLQLNEQREQRHAERLYRTAVTCALLGGLVFCTALLWGLSQL